jgi:phosphatidylinositol-3-phosphatase
MPLKWDENENTDYQTTLGAQNSYLSKLAACGELLPDYHGIGHQSLDNYIAMISGQAPNKLTQMDCPIFSDFDQPSVNGLAVGKGCVFDGSILTIADQFDHANAKKNSRKLTWKAYMEDMNTPCRHPEFGKVDNTRKARPGDQYAARHNPFVYFHSIIDRKEYCDAHDISLGKSIPTEDGLAKDLTDLSTTFCSRSTSLLLASRRAPKHFRREAS